MVKAKLLIIGIFAAVTIFYIGSAGNHRVDASAMGPSPSFTGAPLESNCTVCHTTNAANTGSGNIKILGMPSTIASGQEVDLTVTVTKEDAVIYGFQLTAVGSDGNTAGTFTLPTETVPRLQLIPFTSDQFTRQYVEHTSEGLTGTEFGSNAWTFKWTAPAVVTGPISFFAAGNAADGDGSPSNDFIYTTSAATQSGGTSVTVGGQVFTSDGRGLSKAVVRLKDERNNTRSVITSSLGFYSFADVAAGATYTVTVTSKRFRFQMLAITPSEDLTDLDLIGIE